MDLTKRKINVLYPLKTRFKSLELCAFNTPRCMSNRVGKPSSKFPLKIKLLRVTYIIKPILGVQNVY